jgi:hypothetical protein
MPRSFSKTLWQLPLQLDDQRYKETPRFTKFQHPPIASLTPTTTSTAMSSPITSKNTYTVLASPDEPSPPSDMEISPSPPYVPLTLSTSLSTPSTPSPKPRKSPKATMMKTGGHCPKPQLTRCSSGSPEHGLAKKVTTQATTVTNSKMDKKLAA